MKIIDIVIAQLPLWVLATFYASGMERQERFRTRLVFSSVLFLLSMAVFFRFLNRNGLSMFSYPLSLAVITVMFHACWRNTWPTALYYSIWACLTQLFIYELWARLWPLTAPWWGDDSLAQTLGLLVTLLASCFTLGFTFTRWLPEGGSKRIGPRQLSTAVMEYMIFVASEAILHNSDFDLDGGWEMSLYLEQFLVLVVLYLQSELFKKSAMREELAVMKVLWRKAQDQYQQAQETVAFLNQKYHDMKHLVQAIRALKEEEMDDRLEEIENAVRTYESYIKTGNEVLDTILTEKSLSCSERGIVMSCVADGSCLSFLNTVDLYAILGNALDNAMEAVEKIEERSLRQIDFLLHRQRNFLVIQVINPSFQPLVFEDELPVTTKEDHRYHGYGLRSIRHIVAQYDGCLYINNEDGCFSLKILIPIPQTT